MGLEPTTLRFISYSKSHTLYRLSYPGKGWDDEQSRLSKYITFAYVPRLTNKHALSTLFDLTPERNDDHLYYSGTM